LTAVTALNMRYLQDVKERQSETDDTEKHMKQTNALAKDLLH